MWKIVQLFYDIILFKKSLQDVPSSPFLTRMLLVLYALVSFGSAFMSSHWSVAILETGIDILLLIAFTHLALAWVNKSKRYEQTFCALLGTDTLITIAAIPATAVMLVPSGYMGFLGLIVLIGLILWHWAIIGYILHQALEQPLEFSLGLALLYVMSVYLVIGFFFEH